MPCRGSGHVISNLGGTPSQAPCPWCGGAGVRVPGIDAQAERAAERAAQDASGQASADTAAVPAAEPAAGTPAAGA